MRVGRVVVHQYTVPKHVRLDIGDGRFAFSVDEEPVAAEAMLDAAARTQTAGSTAVTSGPLSACMYTRRPV